MTHPHRRDSGVTDEEREIAREIVETMDDIEKAHGGPMPRRGHRSRAGFERAVAERAGRDEEPDEA
jgi:hypothetical protein